MIRKIGITLLALFLVFGGLSIHAAAQTEWYYIDDLSIAVPIPDDMYFLSRDMNDDDPFLEKLGETPQSILEDFTKYDIYFQLWDFDMSYVYSFNMTTSGLKNMSDFDDTEMQDFIRYTTNEYPHTGNMEVYRSSRGTFLRFSSFSENKESGSLFYNLYYVTVYRGNEIEIELYTSGEPATPEQEDGLKAVVDQIYFGDEEDIFGTSTTPTSSKTATSPKTSKVTSAGPFIYTDSAANTSFIVPANWYQDISAASGKYVQAVFYPNESDDAMIEYGSEDKWLTDYYTLRDGTTRADINNDYFSLEEIADMFDLSVSQVSIEAVNGVEYYKFVKEKDDYNIYNMILYHNGVFYWFSFYGYDDTNYYDDFISLLESVNYPAVSVPESSSAAPVVSGGEGGLSVSAIRTFNINHELLYIALTAVLFILPIILYRYAVRRRPFEPKRALTIVLVYGAVSLAVLTAAALFLAGSWVAVGILLIWHILSYFLLIGGSRKVESAVYIPPVIQGQLYGSYYTPTQPAEIPYQPAPYPRECPAAVNLETQTAQGDSRGNLRQPNFCKTCGSKLKEGSKFCSKCGTEVELIEE